jgi:NAD(P)-dependent dehydrogenase (short-subunit alcohol dehydrogenase family)
VIVTGGGRRFGRQHALLLGSRGARVAEKLDAVMDPTGADVATIGRWSAE